MTLNKESDPGKRVIPWSAEELIPRKQQVMTSIGISEGVKIPEEILALYAEAMEEFRNLSDPKGFYKIIAKKDLNRIYKGEGSNDFETPAELIYKRSDNLALFVFTLGVKVSDRIHDLMVEKDYPLGYMMDRIASESVENAAAFAEIDFAKSSKTEKAFLYSPGYCGWHITAQHKIFEFLKPEEIGVTLSDSSLMSPIKSVTGILISGEKDIHRFKNNYSFCKSCIGFSCRSRIASL